MRDGDSIEAAEFVIVASARTGEPDIWVYIGEAEGNRQLVHISLESARRLVSEVERHIRSM